MKLKKNLFALPLLLMAVAANAQLSVRLATGYALPVARNSIGEMETSYTDDQTNTDKTEEVSASFGSGFSVQAGANYRISKYIGIDLGVQYLVGKSYTVGYKETYYGSEYSELGDLKSTMISISPAILISPGEIKLPYCKLGMVIGSPKVKEEITYYGTGDGIYEETEKWESRKGLSVGFQGAVGMNWMLGNNLSLFSEVSFTSMSYYPKERVMTSNILYGEERIDEVAVRNKIIKYKKEIKNDDQASDKPRQETRISMPFSSIGLQVGITYTFGGINVD